MLHFFLSEDISFIVFFIFSGFPLPLLPLVCFFVYFFLAPPPFLLEITLVNPRTCQRRVLTVQRRGAFAFFV